jgi:hypothetical protein
MTSTQHGRAALPSSTRGSGPGLVFLKRAAIGLVVLVGLSLPAPAAEPSLHIELNKLESNDAGTCLASFVVRNQLGHTLDRFSMDLYVFDRQGVIARQVLLDLAPLRNDKTTVARFNLIQSACGDIGQVLVNDIPSCRSETGETLDCLAGLNVSSRGNVELAK